MNFIYVIHMMCWNYLIALIDLITHSRNRNNRNNSISQIPPEHAHRQIKSTPLSKSHPC